VGFIAGAKPNDCAIGIHRIPAWIDSSTRTSQMMRRASRPRRLMCRSRRTDQERPHRGVNTREDMIFTDMIEQPNDAHSSSHRAAHLGKEQVNVGLTKIACQIAQHIWRADIQQGNPRRIRPVCAMICVRATLMLKKYKGASRRRITKPGMRCAS
jgi:hypothetical protein